MCVSRYLPPDTCGSVVIEKEKEKYKKYRVIDDSRDIKEKKF